MKQQKQNWIGRNHVWLILGFISLLTFVLRTGYAYKDVFGDGYVSFLETDAYFYMDKAKLIAGTLSHPIEALTYTISNNYLFAYLIALIGQVVPIEQAGAWLPPVLAVMAVIAVYFLAARMFNPEIGLLSAFFVAIMPSEFLSRSQLGYTDHHVLEVLLMVTSIYLVIRSIQADKPGKYSVLAGLSIFLYMANSVSGVYLIIGIVGLFIIALLAINYIRRESWHTSMLAVCLPMAIALLIYLPMGGFNRFLFLIPGVQAMQVETTKEIVQTALANPASRTTSELMPLFQPYGKFDPIVIISNLHMFVLSLLLGSLLLWKYRKDKYIILFILWTVVMIAITLNHRRALYYATINIGIISAVAVYYLAKMVKGNLLHNAFIISLPLILISLPLAKNIGEIHPFMMTPEWRNALLVLEKQPNNGYVTAWSDYGHWIKYVSGKQPSYTPGPGGEGIASFLLSTDQAEAKQYLDKLKTGYLIVDEPSLTNKYFALSMYAEQTPQDKALSMGYRLYYDKLQLPYLSLIYESQTIKIYQYKY